MAEAKKILVADDEQQLALAVKIRLQSKGYTVVTASDGQQALQLAAQEKPDLVILDAVTRVDTCAAFRQLCTWGTWNIPDGFGTAPTKEEESRKWWNPFTW